MKSLYVRFFCAAVLLLLTATLVRAMASTQAHAELASGTAAAHQPF